MDLNNLLHCWVEKLSKCKYGLVFRKINTAYNGLSYELLTTPVYCFLHVWYLDFNMRNSRTNVSWSKEWSRVRWCSDNIPWWRHQMEPFSALLAICAGNSAVPGEFTAQRPVTRSFDVFFDLHPNKRLSKQWRGWWFETSSCPLWRLRNECLSSLHKQLGGYMNNPCHERLL